MSVQAASEHRRWAVDAVAALVEHFMGLLLCCDLLDAAGSHTAAREAHRSLMCATTALHVLREELVTISIIERHLRRQVSERGRPPPA
jgi:hypothetical protein